MVIDLSPDDHRRVAFTVVAVFFAARTPLAALSLALDPLHLSAPQGRKRAPLPSPLSRGSSTATVEELDGAGKIRPPLSSPTRTVLLDDSRSLPDPVKPQATTSLCTVAV